MKKGKIIIAAVAITIFDAVVGMITCGGIFNWVYKLEPVSVWKPMEGAPGLGFYVGALVLNIVLALVYALIHKGIPGRNRLVRGLIFGLCIWSIGTLPGMFATYSFMAVNATVVVYWGVLALIQNPLQGLIIAAIYGE